MADGDADDALSRFDVELEVDAYEDAAYGRSYTRPS